MAGERRHFAAGWFRRAFSETVKSAHRAALWTTLAILVVGSALNWYRLRHPAHGKVHQVNFFNAIWPSLAVAGVVLLGFFLFHVFAVPYRMASEAVAQHQEDLTATQQAHKATQALLDQERADHGSAITAIKSESIAEPHRDQVRRIAQAVANSVKNGQPCDYRDPQSALIRHDFRTAVEVHCPDVLAPCDRWDAILEQIERSKALLKESVATEVSKHFAEPWLPQWVQEVVFDKAKLWADLQMDLSEFPLRVDHNELATSDAKDYAWCNGRMVYHKVGLAREEVDQAEAELNAFLSTQTESNPAELLAEAYTLCKAAKVPAIVTALAVLDPHSLPRGEGCPLC